MSKISPVLASAEMKERVASSVGCVILALGFSPSLVGRAARSRQRQDKSELARRCKWCLFGIPFAI